VVLADLDGDGIRDLTLACYGGNSVSTLRGATAPGAATPRFVAKVDFATGTAPSAAAVHDLNGDGLLDVIVTNNGASSFSALVGQ
jgi:hypothetical protein